MVTEPLVKKKWGWLRAGTHLDLVGGLMMCETNNVIMQIGEIFIDTRAGALSETP